MRIPSHSRKEIENSPRESAGRTSDAWLRALDASAAVLRSPGLVLSTLVDELADRFGSAPALIGENETLSYRGLAETANRYARWALAEGIAPGETVCLVMSNRPEYVAIWLGLTRVGIVVALANSHLVGDALRHSIEIVQTTHVIVGAELAGAVMSALPTASAGTRLWAHAAGNHDLPRIDEKIAWLSSDRIDCRESPPPAASDRALYIYTSGTTGRPKAAGVSHFRLLQWSHWFAGMMDTSPADRLYNCLPLYHSVGGVVATGAALVHGAAVVVRRRFSASRFWDDVVEYDCTIFQYIGELCRYLTNSPPHPREREHRLRLCCGNGLRADVWTAFKERFRIPHILEFYAATEGTFSLYNCDERPGAIGRVPSFLAHRSPIALIRVDPVSGEPMRDDRGLCARCGIDEVGEAIGRIASASNAVAGRFEGYSDKEATERKVLRDVLAKGDAWYRTGDLMRRDREGFFYFVDRIGDTFRWKGENVSTTEVGEAISSCPGVLEALVYGVAVAGTEGRAGMAAVVVDSSFSPAALYRHLAARLPHYARPLFVRIRPALATTATFKPTRHELVREGYDPAATTDPLYFFDRDRDCYVPIDADLHRRLESGSVRL
jgi:fatty-acyl-CoA synthase